MLLRALSYLALIAAFFLPWTVGEIVRSVRAHDRRKLTRWSLICGGIVVFLALIVTLAFILSGQLP